MKTRCKGLGNIKNKKNYLNQGISYDPRWEKFENFLEDMGERPDNKTLERVDNTKGYSKSNCKWATYSEQNANKRSATNTNHKHITLYEGVYIVHIKPFKNIRFKTLQNALVCKKELLNIKNNNLKFKEGTMIPDQITYTKRHNEGNYSHSEYTIVASLEENDDVLKCFEQLKHYVIFSIEAKSAIVKEEEHVPQPPVEEVVAEVTPEEPKKPKAVKKVKEKVVEEKVVPYDRNIDAHRQFLSSYLTQTHPEWKTTEGVKEFSLSLIGKPFLDDSGHIVESFKKVLSDFFS
jgi:hypothetical protein